MTFLLKKTSKTSGSSTNNTTANTTSTRDPYAPAKPYIDKSLETGQQIFDKSATLTPEEEAARQKQIGVLQSRQNNPIYAQAQQVGSDLLGGKYNPNITPATSVLNPGAVSGGRDVTASGVTSRNVVAPSVGYQSMGPATQTSGASARAAQGPLDPTGALSKVLSGQADNPQLDAMADAATRQGQRTYQDAVQDSEQSLTRSVLPAVRSGAVQAGGYGGSRQGIAEGLAIAEHDKNLGRAARDLGIASTDASATLRGTAYEKAQDRMASAADSLDSRAAAMAEANAGRTDAASRFDVTNAQDVRKTNADYDYRAQDGNAGRALDADKYTAGLQTSTAVGNADRNLDASKFDVNTSLDVGKTNSGIQLSNNAQELDKAKAMPSILSSGLEMASKGQTMADADFGQLMSVLGLPRSVSQDAFQQWISQLTGVAGVGGSSTGTATGTATGTSKGKTSSFDPQEIMASMAKAMAAGG